MQAIKVVWINNISPMAKGWLINIKIIVVKILIEENNKLNISENSLYKILILEINERRFLFSEVLKKLF